MMLSKPRRLHLLGILLRAIKLLKDFLLPLVLLFVTQILKRGYSLSWLMFTGTVIILVLLAWGLISWFRFTFRVENEVLVVEQGVLIHKRSVIPRERIQAIDLNQGVLHRLFNIVSVQVETAGGDKPEAVLYALSMSDAQLLRRRLLVSGVEEDRNYAGDAVALKRLSLKELFLFGATSGGALGLVLYLFSGAWTLLDDIGLELDLQRYLMWVWDYVNPVYLAAFIILVLWLLAVLGMILKYGDFTLTRSGDRIQMVYGLLQRRQVSIPVGRIRAVRLVEGVLRQPLGYFTVHLESAGYGPRSHEKTLFWPLVRKNELVFLLNKFLPEFAAEIPLQPLPPAAGRRYMLRGFIPAALLALPIFIWLPWGEPALALLLPVLGGLWGFWKYKSAGWGVRGNMLAVRSRSVVRTTFVLPNRSAQSFSAECTPWQHRAGLMSFKMDLASQAIFGLDDVSSIDVQMLTNWFRRRKQSDIRLIED